MSDELVTDEDVEDFDDDRIHPLSLKDCFEGAASLPQLADGLRALADDISRRAAGGWRLHQPVDGGWAHLEQP